MIYDLFNLPNDYTKWGSSATFDTDILHFIVEFKMDNITGTPTDYEFWGGKFLEKIYTPPLSETELKYVNNYLFLYSVVQAIKLAGVTFEIRIEEL